MANFKIGDIVYAIFDNNIITKAPIQECIVNSPRTEYIYKIDVKHNPVPAIYLEKDLFKTEAEAKDEVKRRHDDSVKQYMSEITDVNSLVSFCLNHCVASAEEYTDWNAREAVEIKAKELGLTLNIR